MIYKATSAIPGHVRIIFELPACIWADRIYLAGDFNDWNQRELPMFQERDGAWRVALDLPRGEQFEFRYLVDGQWRTDYHADGCSTNPYGSENSLVVSELSGEDADRIAASQSEQLSTAPSPVEEPLSAVPPIPPVVPPKVAPLLPPQREIFGRLSRSQRLDEAG